MIRTIAAMVFSVCIVCACGATAGADPPSLYRTGPVMGRMVDAGFLLGETNYHAVQLASDGCVYYGIGSHAPGASATLFRYDPRAGKVRALAAMNDVTGEDGSKVFNQGKIHCDLYEMKGKLYFSTQGDTTRAGTSARFRRAFPVVRYGGGEMRRSRHRSARRGNGDHGGGYRAGADVRHHVARHALHVP